MDAVCVSDLDCTAFDVRMLCFANASWFQEDSWPRHQDQLDGCLCDTSKYWRPGVDGKCTVITKLGWCWIAINLTFAAVCMAMFCVSLRMFAQVRTKLPVRKKALYRYSLHGLLLCSTMTLFLLVVSIDIAFPSLEQFKYGGERYLSVFGVLAVNLNLICILLLLSCGIGLMRLWCETVIKFESIEQNAGRTALIKRLDFILRTIQFGAFSVVTVIGVGLQDRGLAIILLLPFVAALAAMLKIVSSKLSHVLRIAQESHGMVAEERFEKTIKEIEGTAFVTKCLLFVICAVQSFVVFMMIRGLRNFMEPGNPTVLMVHFSFLVSIIPVMTTMLLYIRGLLERALMRAPTRAKTPSQYKTHQANTSQRTVYASTALTAGTESSSLA